jgi:hypothetical protein
MITCRLGVYGVSDRPAAVASRNFILSDRREFPVFKCEIYRKCESICSESSSSAHWWVRNQPDGEQVGVPEFSSDTLHMGLSIGVAPHAEAGLNSARPQKSLPPRVYRLGHAVLTVRKAMEPGSPRTTPGVQNPTTPDRSAASQRSSAHLPAGLRPWAADV